MQSDSKYIVFKREDWDEFLHLRAHPASTEALESRALDDATVIRSRDVFAGPGLHAYASTVQTGIELINSLNIVLGGDTMRRMHKIRDYFAHRAHEADGYAVRGESKVPD